MLFVMFSKHVLQEIIPIAEFLWKYLLNNKPKIIAQILEMPNYWYNFIWMAMLVYYVKK